MPTAADIIWDLKLKHYCLCENQDIKNHNINNQVVKRKIQKYMDSKGYPKEGNEEEYSFYFKTTFASDMQAQQKYINDQLNSSKISLCIGHRAIVALLEMGLSKIIFTTNFDEVIETAFSNVTSKNISAFHLEGSYAALEALNAERFPIYAKIHGDFRYQSLKNLPEDLLHNDQEIQKCFLAAANRYGLIVAGYSGRDKNVMEMLYRALEQGNPFPTGLFWTVQKISNVTSVVRDFINAAQRKGVRAHIIETGTFDITLSKIWRQINNRPDSLDKKVRTAKSQPVSVPLPPAGVGYPVLRMNGLPILDLPSHCAAISYKDELTYGDLKRLAHEKKSSAIFTKTDQMLAWGSELDICTALDASKILSIIRYDIENPTLQIRNSTFVKSFYERALAVSLCQDKPLLLRNDGDYHLVVDHTKMTDKIFQSLKSQVGFKGQDGDIAGRVRGNTKAFWAEAIVIRLEERNGQLWLMLRPEIWIDPATEKQNSIDFMRYKRQYRYNPISYGILSAWINILFGSLGDGKAVSISCFRGSTYPVEFTINTRSAYSGFGAANVK